MPDWLAIHALWLYRLLWPSFCMHCDKPVRRHHYRRCNCAVRALAVADLLRTSEEDDDA